MKLKFVVFFLCLPLFHWAQEGMHSGGGDGTGSGGSFSFSFGQFAFENYFEGSSSVAEGVQHPFENDVVPPLYSLFDSTIGDGDLLCYNAQLNMTVAGDDGDVLIENGASSDFIAAGSISFLHGFHALPGSYVSGRITTDGAFCNGLIESTILLLPPVAKSKKVQNDVSFDETFASGMEVKLYPNPNNGRFTLSLTNLENTVSVNVYNMVGASVYQSGTLPEGNVNIQLPFARKGVYFVKLSGEEEQLVKKMIVN
ncbi:MAG: T9SS type A sorting domain-containing protein [Prolixibacteraceae bacterium]|nr:T9SS type A sorting domain-containing protein [Prolixibacteraceae bacterium]